MTFPETQAILDGINVPSATIDDIQTILNMRDAWRYVLKTLDEPFTLDYACRVNYYVARNESLDWGVLRYGEVGIGGTDYKPPIPERRNVEESIQRIMDWDVSITEKTGNTNYSNLVNFLYENGVQGIEFGKQLNQETEMQREMRLDRLGMDLER